MTKKEKYINEIKEALKKVRDAQNAIGSINADLFMDFDNVPKDLVGNYSEGRGSTAHKIAQVVMYELEESISSLLLSLRKKR